MAINAVSLTRNGLRDWLIQRLTAYYMLFYIIGMGIILCRLPEINYLALTQVFTNPWIPVLSFIFVLCVVAHAWIGVWTVLTDYVTCKYARLSLYIIIWFMLLSLLVWSAVVFWSV